jgi:hypothetical protein
MSDRKIKIVYKSPDSQQLGVQIDYKSGNYIRVVLPSSSTGGVPFVFSATDNELLLLSRALKDLFEELGS